MRVFLGAHRPGRAGIGIEQARLLHDPAAALDHVDLALRLIFDGLHDEADAVHVLRLGARAEFVARLAHGDVHVRAHGAFLHIAVARADIAQDRTQLAQIGPRFCRRAHVRAADDFHQRHARAIKVDIGACRVLVVHQLAGILLDMDALDADRLDRGLGILVVQADLDLPLAHQRVEELADLIALRQIGVEIVLAVEARPFVDHRADRHAGAHRLADALLVRRGQHARHRRIDQAHLAVRLRAERGRRAREELGVGSDLRMDFEADHDLPFAGFALDAVGGISHVASSQAQRGVSMAATAFQN